PGVGKNVAHLVRRQQKHDRNDDCARFENSDVGGEHFGAVRHENDDAIARFDAHASERIRDAGAGALLVDVGQLAALEVERHVLAEALDTLFPEPRQVHAPDATIAAMRWLPLGLVWLAMATAAGAVDDWPLREPEAAGVSAPVRCDPREAEELHEA